MPRKDPPFTPNPASTPRDDAGIIARYAGWSAHFIERYIQESPLKSWEDRTDGEGKIFPRAVWHLLKDLHHLASATFYISKIGDTRFAYEDLHATMTDTSIKRPERAKRIEERWKIDIDEIDPDVLHNAGKMTSEFASRWGIDNLEDETAVQNAIKERLEEFCIGANRMLRIQLSLAYAFAKITLEYDTTLEEGETLIEPEETAEKGASSQEKTNKEAFSPATAPITREYIQHLKNGLEKTLFSAKSHYTTAKVLPSNPMPSEDYSLASNTLSSTIHQKINGDSEKRANILKSMRETFHDKKSFMLAGLPEELLGPRINVKRSPPTDRGPRI